MPGHQDPFGRTDVASLNGGTPGAPSPGTTPAPPGSRRARACRLMARACTLVSEEHGTAPRIRMAALTSGGADALEAHRWRPLRELGKSWFNERCATRSKERSQASGDPGPAPPGGTTDNTPRGREAPSTTRCIETKNQVLILVVDLSREAPSTTRCIETRPAGRRGTCHDVGKRPAPSGALRPDIVDCGLSWYRRTGIIY